jgi:hypothetical protein
VTFFTRRSPLATRSPVFLQAQLPQDAGCGALSKLCFA